MNLLHFLNLTQQPWYIDIASWAVLITALGTIWQKGMWPILRAVWAAILAAPKIASGINDLVGIVEGDVLSRLDEAAKRFEQHWQEIENHRAQIADHEDRIKVIEEFRQ